METVNLNLPVPRESHGFNRIKSHLNWNGRTVTCVVILGILSVVLLVYKIYSQRSYKSNDIDLKKELAKGLPSKDQLSGKITPTQTNRVFTLTAYPKLLFKTMDPQSVNLYFENALKIEKARLLLNLNLIVIPRMMIIDDSSGEPLIVQQHILADPTTSLDDLEEKTLHQMVALIAETGLLSISPTNTICPAPNIVAFTNTGTLDSPLAGVLSLIGFLSPLHQKTAVMEKARQCGIPITTEQVEKVIFNNASPSIK